MTCFRTDRRYTCSKNTVEISAEVYWEHAGKIAQIPITKGACRHAIGRAKMLIGSVNQCRENRCYIITVSSATNATRRTHMREFRPRASHNTTCGHSLWCGRRRMPLEGLTCASSTQGPRIPPPRRERHPKMEHGLFLCLQNIRVGFLELGKPTRMFCKHKSVPFSGCPFSFSFLVQPHSCRRPMMSSPCYAKID